MKRRNSALHGLRLKGVSAANWREWAIYRTTRYKTTWKLRLGLAALLVLLAVATRGGWIPAIARGLVAQPGPCRPDVIVVDNLVSDYMLFKKAGALGKLEGARMVLVPVRSSGKDPDKPDAVTGEIAAVMVRQARLQPCRFLPFREVEPFTLNVARQVGRFIRAHPDIHSVMVVTQALRSRRTRLVYGRVLGKLGVAVCTYPVWGTRRPEAWAATWHGRQEVVLQYLKLFYYELLLFHSR
jgi:hypothetical protein